MKNVLMLTTLYPADDVKFLNNTSVCHYFAREWNEQGYNVRVVFLYNLFPFFFYPLLKLLSKKIANKSGIAVLDKYLPNDHDYILDNVKVSRIPVKKSRPGGGYKLKDVQRVSNRLVKILQRDGFIPDMIVSHFLHPSLEIINELKRVYNVPTAVSIHGKEKVFSKEIAKKLDSVDYIGYRSIPIGSCFEKLYGKKQHFYCFSGVPSKYIVDSPKSFVKGIRNFIFVGSLIERKHPACLIQPITKVMGNDDYSITFVGNGNQKKKVERIALENKCIDRVFFTGNIDRDAVTNELDKADVFIMLSSEETFGLVYLEAMARGCIVVASKDEGMDGIVKHGVNGFLCKAGDVDELSCILAEIRSMDSKQLSAISESGLQTVRNMTDKIMAERYINFLKDE